jgi:hypothetical protein
MNAFELDTTFTINECITRLNSLADSPLYIARARKLDLYPLRIQFSISAPEPQSASVRTALATYQSTVGGWRYDYIPIWDSGALEVRMTEMNGMTQVMCRPVEGQGFFRRFVPLELALWTVLIFVQCTFIYRAFQEPNTGNIAAVLLFAIVPLFYAGVKWLIQRNTSSALENLFYKTFKA